MDKGKESEQYFEWCITSIAEKGISAQSYARIIIYCQTIKQCHLLFTTFKRRLGSQMYKDCKRLPSNVLVEMLHSCTPVENKDNILKSSRQGWYYEATNCYNCFWYGGELQGCSQCKPLWTFKKH